MIERAPGATPLAYYHSRVTCRGKYVEDEKANHRPPASMLQCDSYYCMSMAISAAFHAMLVLAGERATAMPMLLSLRLLRC